ncbi:putative RNA-binding protein [Erysiphe neolycopersici]|uniref:U4/U6 snRNA-associated-splicing factor PRP24 n=1 Tax=Erysiphe neolycopersici TaxID=212602 RepID=A0A420I2V7_9PEZI|nr:putative RNA-binding protein [Erysiphe neolycopersici]
MSDPTGEEGWLALADESKRNATDLEKCVEVVECYKRAITLEPCSIKIWLAYCEWFWSLYEKCQNSKTGWPEEEYELGKEIFNLETALDIWQHGAHATKYRLNDSNEIWNRWISIELQSLSGSRDEEKINHIRELFNDRLQTPHSTWDDTSQMFSTFLTNFSESTWEASMIKVTKISKEAKDTYRQREQFELKLKKAVESGSNEAVKSQMLDYLSWEQNQAFKKNKKGALSKTINLCIALFERALTSTQLAVDPTVWEDYIVFLLSFKSDCSDVDLPSIISICYRGTSHCPWSGALWARYILCAEMEPLPFARIEQIKHTATNNRELDRDGMNDVILFYIAWCGYLKRRTMIEGATDEDHDLAEMGLPTALEDVTQWGIRCIGKSWKGDPYFRIETILIQNLTERHALEEARELWQGLVATHADSYDFWYQYYQWEMIVRDSKGSPTIATAVLAQAIRHKTLDWPEKMMEVYVKHCNNHENANVVLQATNMVHRIAKGVAKRREREAAVYQTELVKSGAEKQCTISPTDQELNVESQKRKRETETETEEEIEGTSKKIKTLDQTTVQEQNLKRDRENTTVIVTNLPPEVTQTKVKNYFKDYAHINSLLLKTEVDKISSIALIELRTREDVQSALLKDRKYFGDRQISVMPATGLTLYVTNFPPTADDDYFQNLFKDCGEILSIRWPSVKYRTSRRFVYISFRTSQAAEAAVKLNGLSLGNIYRLYIAYSNPNIKKDREGATAEGREIHVTNLDTSLTEEDINETFSKYGTVQRVNILKKLSGKSKGAAFIVFETKEQASAALELDKTKLKSSVLSVEISKERNYKPTAVIVNKNFQTPSVDNDLIISPRKDHDTKNTNFAESKASFGSEIAKRTITLLNIPDTINDARIRLLCSSFGEITRLVLRPDHQGAIIEFSDSISASNAILGLENYEILPGRRLRTGILKDLFMGKDADKRLISQIKKPAIKLMQPATKIQRPIPPATNGKKKKLILAKSSPSIPIDSISSESNDVDQRKGKKQMSNADFKALVSKGK